MSNLSDRIAAQSANKRELLRQRLNQRMQPADTAIRRRGTHSKEIPISAVQYRLWLLEQLAPGTVIYTIPLTFQLVGQLDFTALLQSLTEIMRRHEILRTSFPVVGGYPVQLIADPMPLEVELIDLRELSVDARETEATRLARQKARQSFHLSHGPLVRASLLHLEEQKYLLLMNVHHLIFDGWSIDVFLRELSVLYVAYCHGQPSPLPELAIQYADFTIWQRQWLQTEIMENQLTYWKRQLAGAPALLDLPIDHTRPALQSFRGATISFLVPRARTEALKALSQQEGVTLFMTLLAAWQTLLFRYTRQEDLVVGTPFAGRTRRETEELIGFFVNTLVLRTDLSGNPRFRQLLQRVRRVALEAYDHQDVPFDQLVEVLRPTRDPRYNPLFQTLFSLQNISREPINMGEVTLKQVQVETSTAKFDLSLELVETAQGLEGSLEYSSDLFEADTASRIVGHLQMLLEGIVSHPDQFIGEIPVLTEGERQQLLVQWNATQESYPHEQCIHDPFEAWVERDPEAVAIVIEDQQLSYSELNRRANQVAHYLRDRGIGPNTRVGLYFERSPELVISMLGVLKAGAAYVPLDPSYPVERLVFTLEDAKISILLSHRFVNRRGLDTLCDTILIDHSQQAISRAGDHNPSRIVSSRDLAYIIYTSGSTGRPKGVAISHRSVTNLFYALDQRFGCSTTDVVLAPTSISFDISVLELLWAFARGARVILLQNIFAVRELCKKGVLNSESDRYNPTILQCTPSVLPLLLADEETVKMLQSLRLLLLTGEALPLEVAVHARRLLRGRIMNMYGPTETTVWSAMYELPENISTIAIGRPIKNTQIYILDHRVELVPVGVVGELYIGGDGLAQGYWERPGITAERFVPHPFSAQPGARLYRSGDLARYLPDGNIQFIGRADHQVKIRGFRIELGEIEAVLRTHPGVQGAVVIVADHYSSSQAIIAYVVMRPEVGGTPAELRAFLERKLPPYMVPVAVVLLDEFPTMPNGKIDRHALPRPARTADDRGHHRPRAFDALEYQLTRIWEEVLKLSPIGLQDNFFELGGDSISVLSLVFKMEAEIGTKVPVSLVLEEPTIERLAIALRRQGETGRWQSLVQLQSGGHQPPIFFVHAFGGHVARNVRISQLLGTNRTVYGIQARGLHLSETPHVSIANMGSFYIKELCEVYPEGPYLLGGYSLGGIIAFEMAQQLCAAGHSVGLLAIIDTPAPLNRELTVEQILTGYIDILMSDLLRMGGHLDMDHLKPLEPEQQIEYLLSQGLKIGFWSTDTTHANVRRLAAVARINAQALVDYIPKQYKGRLVLFRAVEEGAHIEDMGWKNIVLGGVDVHEISASHENILSPPAVQVVAEILKRYMDADEPR